jgi:hypothetical protein
MAGASRRRRPAPRERHPSNLDLSLAGRGPFHRLPGPTGPRIRESTFRRPGSVGRRVEFPPIGRRAASRILIAHLIGDVLRHAHKFGQLSCFIVIGHHCVVRRERSSERTSNVAIDGALVQSCPPWFKPVGEAHHKDFSPRSSPIRMIGNLRTERSGSQLAAASRSIRREHPQQDAKRPVRLVLLPRAKQKLRTRPSLETPRQTLTRGLRCSSTPSETVLRARESSKLA